MSQTATAHPTAFEPSAESSLYLRAYRWMLLSRIAEEKIASAYRGGKITGGVFLGRGQQALSVSLGSSLQPGDVLAPLIRDQAARLAFGESLLDMTRTYFGSRQGPMRGRDGNIHRGRPKQGMLAMISHLGAMISTVNGILMARRFQGKLGTVGAATLGDGATSTGAFHEALNQAAVERLPLVLMVANNQYAYSTPNRSQFACRDLVDKAIGYGIEGHTVDGTILADCLEVVGHAVERARSGKGPQLVVANLLRLVGHGEHDDAHYVDPTLRQSALGRDCVQLAEQHLLAEGLADAASVLKWHEQATLEVEEAIATALRESPPDPNEEDWSAISTRSLTDGFAPA